MPEDGFGLYRDHGIVLRGIRLGEADRILTVYTRANGRIRAVAKGIRKARSKFGARLDAFTHVDLQLYRGRSDLDIVTQAAIAGRYPRLRTDYRAFCAAGAMADAVERTTPDREQNVRLFALLRDGLGTLDAGAADPAVVAFAFLAKVASMGGHHPVLEQCVECGAAERVAFSFGGGGAVCGGCARGADPRASEAALDGWTAFLGHRWEELRGLEMPVGARRELGGLLLGFVQWQTESRLRAFGLLAAP